MALSLVRIQTVSSLRTTSDKGATVPMRWGIQAYAVTSPVWSVRRTAGLSPNSAKSMFASDRFATIRSTSDGIYQNVRPTCPFSSLKSTNNTV